MTDNEIIKALECCIKNTCNECPFYKNWITHRCGELRNLALDLINRQKAEMERLNKEIDRLSQCVMYHEGQIAEAIEEFAEAVFSVFPIDKDFTTISRFTIKQIAKYLTESPTKIEHSSLCETETYEVKE